MTDVWGREGEECEAGAETPSVVVAVYGQVTCPQACGEEVMRKNLSFHQQHQCSRRTVTCR